MRFCCQYAKTTSTKIEGYIGSVALNTTLSTDTVATNTTLSVDMVAKNTTLCIDTVATNTTLSIYTIATNKHFQYFYDVMFFFFLNLKCKTTTMGTMVYGILIYKID